ncbi:MAG: NADH-quinone oxidoreductase subunit K, partial [Methanoregulaceae archaeon]|nr:NADH-quinone oxidoreductase subunit K [Methanoregulaceae archaeon]
MFWNLPYVAVVLLTVIGLATILLKRNLIKIFLGVSILTSAVN